VLQPRHGHATSAPSSHCLDLAPRHQLLLDTSICPAEAALTAMSFRSTPSERSPASLLKDLCELQRRVLPFTADMLAGSTMAGARAKQQLAHPPQATAAPQPSPPTVDPEPTYQPPVAALPQQQRKRVRPRSGLQSKRKSRYQHATAKQGNSDSGKHLLGSHIAPSALHGPPQLAPELAARLPPDLAAFLSATEPKPRMRVTRRSNLCARASDNLLSTNCTPSAPAVWMLGRCDGCQTPEEVLSGDGPSLFGAATLAARTSQVVDACRQEAAAHGSAALLDSSDPDWVGDSEGDALSDTISVVEMVLGGSLEAPLGSTNIVLVSSERASQDVSPESASASAPSSPFADEVSAVDMASEGSDGGDSCVLNDDELMAAVNFLSDIDVDMDLALSDSTEEPLSDIPSTTQRGASHCPAVQQSTAHVDTREPATHDSPRRRFDDLLLVSLSSARATTFRSHIVRCVRMVFSYVSQPLTRVCSKTIPCCSGFTRGSHCNGFDTTTVTSVASRFLSAELFRRTASA